MFRSISEFFCIVFLAVSGIFTASTLCFVSYEATLGRYGCEHYAQATGLTTSHSVSGGCYVKLPDGTVVKQATAEAAQLRKFQHMYQIETK